MFKRELKSKDVVKSISFTIQDGEKVGLIGPNGAGKTTTMKLLTGILYPTSGSAEVMGFTPWKREKGFKMKTTFLMGQKSQLWVDLPAMDTLSLNRYIYEIDEARYNSTVKELMDLLEVEHLKKIQVRRLSLGERMKFEFIAAMLHLPETVFLDEPTIGLDMVAQKSLREFLKEYNRKYNATIMLTSHYLKDIEDICNRVILINNGEIMFDDSLAALKKIIDNRKVIVFEDTGMPKSEIEKIMGRPVTILDAKVRTIVDKDEIYQVMPIVLEKLSKNVSMEDTSLEDIVEQFYLKGATEE